MTYRSRHRHSTAHPELWLQIAIAFAALAIVIGVLSTVAGCANPLDEKYPATAVDGDAAYIAGDTIRPGLWYFANATPHADGKACSWSVAEKVSGQSLAKTVASRYDPGNSVQSMYVAPGQYLMVHGCGKGGWLANTPTPGPVAS